MQRLILAMLVVVGCSGGNVVLPSVPAPGGGVSHLTGDICYALSDNEVTAAMGKLPIGGGSGFDQGGLRTCNWTITFSPVESVGLTLEAASAYEQARFGGEESVPGIGSGAYWSAGINQLYVKTAKGTLIVLVWSETVTPRTAAIQLAKLAVPRL